MRKLARGNTPSDCLKSVERMKKAGWTPITDVKVDDSGAYMGDVSYVVVMEAPDSTFKNKKHRWNNDLPIIR